MYLGDFAANSPVDIMFDTTSNGAPITLGGTPSVKVYKANGLTEDTAGVTLTVDFDGVTGLHHVRVVTTGVFYAAGNTYHAVLAAGTVDGVSVAGRVLGAFSIDSRTSGTGASAEDVWTYGSRVLTTPGNNIVVNPFTGNLTLVRGDDYPLGIAGALLPSFSSSAWPDLTDADPIEFSVRSRTSDALIFTVEDDVASRVTGDGVQAVSFELSSTETVDLPVGTNAAKWDIQATLVDGSKKTLMSGLMTVVEDETRA
jgi:hypothetical protein